MFSLQVILRKFTLVKYLFELRGQGVLRPKIFCYAIFVEGNQSYQMLFTGSKNIDPNWIYCIFKICLPS